MINWNFDAKNVEETSFELIAKGDHRVRISNAEETKSKNGNDMIKITLDVSNYSGKLFNYLVFMPDNKAMTDTNLSRFWESFGIPVGNLNVASWIGKIGACRVKHELYNDEQQARVAYFLDKKKQETLPQWIEKSVGGKPVDVPGWVGDADSAPFATDDLPF